MKKIFFLIYILTSLASCNTSPLAWNTVTDWKRNQDNLLSYEATSQEALQACSKNPNSYLVFPNIAQGAQEIWLDGERIVEKGDLKFKRADTYYGFPFLTCGELKPGKMLTWKVVSFIDDVAFFNEPPFISQGFPIKIIFAEILNLISAGGLFILAFFCLVLFWRKISNAEVFTVALASFFWSIYHLMTVAGFVHLKIPMFYAHKISDSSLAVGTTLYLLNLMYQNIIHRKIFYGYLACSVICVSMILLGKNGTEIQQGTSVLFVPSILLLFYSFYTSLRNLVKTRNRYKFSKFASITIYIIGTINDVMIYMAKGLYNGPILFWAASLFAILFMTFSINEKIMEAYLERDHLRKNLEVEVDLKTRDLTQSLEKIKTMQADLVQSEKLASLGTLSAGIAHEINNTLNQIKNSIPPLEKYVDTKEENEKAKKFIKIIKDSLSLTLDIINGLLSFSRNSASEMDINIKSLTNSVFMIVKNKVNENIQIQNEIDPSATAFVNPTSLNQILINLFTNSLDALEGRENSVIKITNKNEDDKVSIIFEDNGPGIEKALQEKIFDPFFTTKEVGKGTGLGLYIVKNEVKKNHGEMYLVSEVGSGTKFILTFPAKGRLAA